MRHYRITGHSIADTRRPAAAAIVWAARFVLLGLLAVCLLSPEGLAARKDGPSMQIAISLSRDSFLITEPIALRVSIRNTGAAPIDVPDALHEANWQPTFTITGPAYVRGYTFSARSAILQDSSPQPADVQPVVSTLAPGASFERTVPLHMWLQLHEPGQYRLVAQLHWNGASASSAPVAFYIEKPSIQSISLGADLGVELPAQIQAGWLHQGNGQRRAFRAVFTEERPDLGEVSAPTAIWLQDAGPDATDLLTPWTNFDRQAGFHHWLAWREGARLLARALIASQPAALDLGAAPQRLVRPALLPSSGNLDVFAISANAAELLLARFPAPQQDGRVPAAQALWRLALPKGVLSARATLAPEAAGGERRVVLLAQQDDTLLVLPVNARDGRKPADLKPLRMPGAYAISNADPAVRVDAAGLTHAAVLFAKDRERRQFAIADLRFTPDGAPVGNPVITALAQSPIPAVAASVAYGAWAEDARRDWVILLNNGQIIDQRHPAQPQRPDAPPAVPLELAVRSQATYLVVLDPAKGPRLMALQ